MLEELAKHDRKWRNMALSICGDITLADDLTQDMYIKLSECGKTYEEINEWYVYVTIKHIWFHHIRQRKRVVMIDDFLDNRELLRIKDCNKRTEARQLIHEALEELKMFDREILLHTSERSLRDNEKYLGITYGTLNYRRNIALRKLEETKTIKNEQKRRT